jgi:hypothetical protein
MGFKFNPLIMSGFDMTGPSGNQLYALSGLVAPNITPGVPAGVAGDDDREVCGHWMGKWYPVVSRHWVLGGGYWATGAGIYVGEGFGGRWPSWFEGLFPGRCHGVWILAAGPDPDTCGHVD